MNLPKLKEIAQALVVRGKGILAMDESTSTANKRFAALGIEQTPDSRRRYREMLVTAPGLGEYVSGAILYDETIRQKLKDGRYFVDALRNAGILPGIKVDLGAKPLAGFPGEKVTEGLDGLRERLIEYFALGAVFAKWRSVINMDGAVPTRTCVEANAHGLARYAALCQESGLVPIVEPEVLVDGRHDLRRCFEVTEQVLKAVFSHLYDNRVELEGMILKPSMILPGKDNPEKASEVEVARATVDCLRRCVPASVPGVAFLSGGQSPELATAHLNAANALEGPRAPWILTFSYARALQSPAMKAWAGKDENASAAQQSLLHRARCNSQASLGQYSPKMEKEAPQTVPR